MVEPITKNPEEEKHMIWSNLDLDLDDWRDDLLEEDPDLTEDELYQRMIELNDDYLDDERCNLNIETGTQIIALGDLGLWYGRVSGYKVIESGNIKDCLAFDKDIDYAEWYVDGDGEFKGTGIHHDGVNYYTYRAVREDATENDVDHLLELIYENRATQKDVERVTRRLGDDIGRVYGWDFPEPTPIVAPLSGIAAYCEAVQKHSVQAHSSEMEQQDEGR